MATLAKAGRALHATIYTTHITGSLVATRAKQRSQDNTDYDTMERNINRDEDPSEAWLRQRSKGGGGVKDRLSMFNELEAATKQRWGLYSS